MNLFGLFTHESGGHLFDVVILWVVDIDLDLSESIEDFLTGVINQIFEGAIQLFDGDIHGFVGLCSDDVHDRLGLC